MKRKTSKEILAESFRELAQEKNIDKITVKDIVQNCGYSQATFYRRFKDKYDLIAWSYTQDLEAIMRQLSFDETSWKKVLLDAAHYYRAHRDYLSNLLLRTGGYVSFFRYMSDINYNSLKTTIGKSQGDSPDEKTDMYIRLYCQGTVALTCDWILGRYRATPAELAEIYENALPEPLKRYLY